MQKFLIGGAIIVVLLFILYLYREKESTVPESSGLSGPSESSEPKNPWNEYGSHLNVMPRYEDMNDPFANEVLGENNSIHAISIGTIHDPFMGERDVSFKPRLLKSSCE